jgi:hypothetical protein
MGCLRTAWVAAMGVGLVLVFAPHVTSADSGLTDEQIRERIVAESLRSYPGNCPCPYHVDRAGRSCGKRSAWSRVGGYSPICYAREVSEEQVREFRARQRT